MSLRSWWQTRQAVKRWMRGRQLRRDFAFYASNQGITVGDPEYYRQDCTIDEFEHLLDVVEESLDVRQDKMSEARRMIP